MRYVQSANNLRYPHLKYIIKINILTYMELSIHILPQRSLSWKHVNMSWWRCGGGAADIINAKAVYIIRHHFNPVILRGCKEFITHYDRAVSVGHGCVCGTRMRL